MLGFDIFVLVVVFLFVATIISGVKTVQQGYHYTVERFGRYTRTLHPGLALIVPFVDRIGHKMNMMEQVLAVPRQEVITKDNAMVQVDGVAFFQVLDAAQAGYEVNNLNVAILNLTMTNIRTVMGSMDLDELLSQRDEINHRLLKVVDDATQTWGVKVTRIEIKDINPPRDLVDSMARQMKAERDKRALVLEAEAKATQMVSDAISTGNVQAINYFVANNYVEALKELAGASNQKVLMLPIEASSVIGAIGGLAEITREAFGNDGGGNSHEPPAPSAPKRPQPQQPRPRSGGAVPSV